MESWYDAIITILFSPIGLVFIAIVAGLTVYGCVKVF